MRLYSFSNMNKNHINASH